MEHYTNLERENYETLSNADAPLWLQRHMAEKFAKVSSQCSWVEHFTFPALCLYVGVEQLWWEESGSQVTQPEECAQLAPTPSHGLSIPKQIVKKKKKKKKSPLEQISQSAIEPSHFFLKVHWFLFLSILNKWDDFSHLPKSRSGTGLDKDRKSAICRKWQIKSETQEQIY